MYYAVICSLSRCSVVSGVWRQNRLSLFQRARDTHVNTQRDTGAALQSLHISFLMEKTKGGKSLTFSKNSLEWVFKKKYLQAYHLLTGSVQAAYEHGFQTVIPYCLSEFIFLTTGLLSDAIPEAKCTHCVSADPRNESCYHVQYHVNTSLSLVSRKTEKNEVKFLLIHFKCKECVQSLPRSRVSFMPQRWSSKMCFLSFTLSERSAEVWGSGLVSNKQLYCFEFFKGWSSR